MPKYDYIKTIDSNELTTTTSTRLLQQIHENLTYLNDANAACSTFVSSGSSCEIDLISSSPDILARKFTGLHKTIQLLYSYIHTVIKALLNKQQDAFLPLYL
jgi:hypothetical protein